MTKLERRIKASTLLTIRRIKPEEQNTNTRYVSFISECEGVFDEVTYDKVTKQYEVKYKVNGKKKDRSLVFKL